MQKDCYDALSYDTLVKACAAAGVNADGLVQFSRFEIDGLSDDGFEKCKGLFYDAFFRRAVRERTRYGRREKYLRLIILNATTKGLKNAVKIACGETVGVKSAKIVAAYGLKDEDREVFLENALKIRFGTGGRERKFIVRRESCKSRNSKRFF
ncbi:MAG: hypothetical protein L6V85_05925 [Clostridiales bacterium]|nr:MAG: hypothetical protein L6V85_05925 [Clostridiales bacterium]